MAKTQWIPGPELTAPIVDPKGRVTGVVRIAFLDHCRVNVSTGKPGVMFRKIEWSINIPLNRTDSGEWFDYEEFDFQISKQHTTRDYAPKATRATIVAALIATVEAHWTPALAEKARVAHATHQLARLERDIKEAQEKLDALLAKAAPYKKLLYG